MITNIKGGSMTCTMRKLKKKCKLLLMLCNAMQHICISECVFHLSPANIIFCFSQCITRATDILTLLGRVWTQDHEWVKILDFKYNFVYTGATVYNFSWVYSESNNLYCADNSEWETKTRRCWHVNLHSYKNCNTVNIILWKRHFNILCQEKNLKLFMPKCLRNVSEI